MLVPESIVDLLKPWADLYGHSKGVETLVQALHIGGLLLAGGFAIAADRTTLRSSGLPPEARAFALGELSSVHRWVLTGLTIVALSGVGLVTADIETFFASKLYWVKMALVVALLANGYVITRIEGRIAREGGAATGGTTAHWQGLRRTSMTSLVLWFTITVAGVALVNLS